MRRYRGASVWDRAKRGSEARPPVPLHLEASRSRPVILAHRTGSEGSPSPIPPGRERARLTSTVESSPRCCSVRDFLSHLYDGRSELRRETVEDSGGE
jgi:hypothetical protein